MDTAILSHLSPSPLNVFAAVGATKIGLLRGHPIFITNSVSGHISLQSAGEVVTTDPVYFQSSNGTYFGSAPRPRTADGSTIPDASVQTLLGDDVADCGGFSNFLSASVGVSISVPEMPKIFGKRSELGCSELKNGTIETLYIACAAKLGRP